MPFLKSRGTKEPSSLEEIQKIVKEELKAGGIPQQFISVYSKALSSVIKGTKIKNIKIFIKDRLLNLYGEKKSMDENFERFKEEIEKYITISDEDVIKYEKKSEEATIKGISERLLSIEKILGKIKHLSFIYSENIPIRFPEIKEMLEEEKTHIEEEIIKERPETIKEIYAKIKEIEGEEKEYNLENIKDAVKEVFVKEIEFLKKEIKKEEISDDRINTIQQRIEEIYEKIGKIEAFSLLAKNIYAGIKREQKPFYICVDETPEGDRMYFAEEVTKNAIPIMLEYKKCVGCLNMRTIPVAFGETHRILLSFGLSNPINRKLVSGLYIEDFELCENCLKTDPINKEISWIKKGDRIETVEKDWAGLARIAYKLIEYRPGIGFSERKDATTTANMLLKINKTNLSKLRNFLNSVSQSGI